MINYLLENREAVREQLIAANLTEAQIDIALSGYDFAAQKAVELNKSYELLLNTIRLTMGESKADNLELLSAKRFLEIETEIRSYLSATSEPVVEDEDYVIPFKEDDYA